MGVNFLGASQQSSNTKVTANPVSSGVSHEVAQKFGELVSQAKARLENPLGDVQFDTADTRSESVSLGLGSSQLSLESNDDAFSGVDSMNTRVFASIRDTINQKLASLKQGRSEGPTQSDGGLSAATVSELTQMGVKIAELYAASDSVSYKKTAEKTIAKIAAKLNAAIRSGNESAVAGLEAIQEKLPEDSRPRFLVDLMVDDHPSVTG